MPDAPTSPIAFDALVGATELAAAVDAALERLGLAFPGKRAAEALEQRNSVYLDACDGLDPAAFPGAVKRLIQETAYYPSGHELRQAVLAEQKRRAEAGAPVRGAMAAGGRLPAFAGAPWDVCPHCLAAPMLAPRWVAVTCRGQMPRECGDAVRAACDHPVHQLRAPDGGPGRHVEWVLAFDVSGPPRCDCWAHVWAGHTATTSTVPAALLPDHLKAYVRARAGDPPAAAAGTAAPADWRERLAHRSGRAAPDPAGVGAAA